MPTPLNEIAFWFRIMREVLGSGHSESDAFDLLTKKLGMPEVTFRELAPKARASRGKGTNLPDAKLPVTMKFTKLSDFFLQDVRRLEPLLLSVSGKAVIGCPPSLRYTLIVESGSRTSPLV
jgi:hypothetical protein